MNGHPLYDHETMEEKEILPGDNVQILFRLVGGVVFNPTTIAEVMTTPVENDNGNPAVVNLQRLSGGAPSDSEVDEADSEQEDEVENSQRHFANQHALTCRAASFEDE